MSSTKSIPADVIAKLQKFDELITKLEDAVEEVDVGVEKHFEVRFFPQNPILIDNSLIFQRSAHEMALVDTMSMFLMDSLMWAVQATKGGGADKNDDLLIDLVRFF